MAGAAGSQWSLLRSSGRTATRRRARRMDGGAASMMTRGVPWVVGGRSPLPDIRAATDPEPGQGCYVGRAFECLACSGSAGRAIPAAMAGRRRRTRTPIRASATDQRFGRKGAGSHCRWRARRKPSSARGARATSAMLVVARRPARRRLQHVPPRAHRKGSEVDQAARLGREIFHTADFDLNRERWPSVGAPVTPFADRVCVSGGRPPRSFVAFCTGVEWGRRPRALHGRLLDS